MLLHELEEKKLVKFPSWMADNTHYLTIMGSVSYGVSTDTSDMDVYGWAIPPKEIVFPHLAGYVRNFGPEPPGFEQFQEHHIMDESGMGGKGREYDITVYNIVKYFDLCLVCTPNILASMFVRQSCILHCSRIGNMVRENRHLFLCKMIWPKFKGYAFSQLAKMQSKNPTGKRAKTVEAHGYDTKYAYNIVRLLSEAEQILATGDLDLQEKGRREHMKAIRRGDVSEQEIREWASAKELELEKLYNTSTLPYEPRRNEIKQLLLNCLEDHYGNLDKCVINPDGPTLALKEIRGVLERYNL